MRPLAPGRLAVQHDRAVMHSLTPADDEHRHRRTQQRDAGLGGEDGV